MFLCGRHIVTLHSGYTCFNGFQRFQPCIQISLITLGQFSMIESLLSGYTICAYNKQYRPIYLFIYLSKTMVEIESLFLLVEMHPKLS